MPFKFNPFTGKLDLVDVATIPATVAEDYVTDAGTATAAANILNVLGGTGLNTAGASNTLTINMDSPVTVANGGTGQTSLTDGAILVGDTTSAVELIGPLTDGQLLIGDTAGVSPVAASLSAPAAGFSISGGAGTITFALTDDLAALEGLAGTGIAVRTAASTWTNRSIAVTASTGLSISNGDGVAANPTLSGIDATSSVKGVATFDENDFLVTSADVTLADRTRLKAGYVENLGISYNGGTGVFEIEGADGNSLLSTNPGIVVLQSKSNPGQLVKYEITSNQNFTDDVGSSEIIDNLFGTTTGRAWANAMPFYIYAVTNDDEDNIQFMISRVPHATSSPAAANIGAPDDAVADTQGSFWSLENIDETLYDTNPCICIGSFTMVKSASDDWTVQTLTNDHGIGEFQEDVFFTFPSGQMGNDASSYFVAGAGTVPAFTTNQSGYQIEKSGYCSHSVNFIDDAGTDGSGSVPVKMALAFSANINGLSSFDYLGGFGGTLATGGPSSGVTIRAFPLISSATPSTIFLYTNADFMEYGDYGNGNRAIGYLLRFNISLS